MNDSLYVYWKKKEKNYINSIFSGKSKEGQNHKVLETLRNYNRVFL